MDSPASIGDIIYNIHCSGGLCPAGYCSQVCLDRFLATLPPWGPPGDVVASFLLAMRGGFGVQPPFVHQVGPRGLGD